MRSAKLRTVSKAVMLGFLPLLFMGASGSCGGPGEMSEAGNVPALPTICEESHGIRVLIDELEILLRHGIDQARAGRLTPAYISEMRTEFLARINQLLSPELRYRIAADRACLSSGQKTRCQHPPEFTVPEQTRPIDVLHWAHVRTNALTDSTGPATMCGPGPAYREGDGGTVLVEDPCANRVRPGAAVELLESLSGLRSYFNIFFEVAPSDYLVQEFRDRESVVLGIIDQLTSVRENGVTTYLALQCSTTEAFALLRGATHAGRRGKSHPAYADPVNAERRSRQALAVAPGSNSADSADPAI
ncbi:MAG: hypothetical protein IT285_05310 [Bdellovibrionales bacterium]|nr:hypothetical protein [Bdellovibrionales bacterium]